jgi:choline dehydrogenase-like flavoprotein
LDGNLKTQFDSLYVCDASTFPDALVRGPALTIISLGKRLAKHLNATVLGRSKAEPQRATAAE